MLPCGNKDVTEFSFDDAETNADLATPGSENHSMLPCGNKDDDFEPGREDEGSAA